MIYKISVSDNTRVEKFLIKNLGRADDEVKGHANEEVAEENQKHVLIQDWKASMLRSYLLVTVVGTSLIGTTQRGQFILGVLLEDQSCRCL